MRVQSLERDGHQVGEKLQGGAEAAEVEEEGVVGVEEQQAQQQLRKGRQGGEGWCVSMGAQVGPCDCLQ